MKTPVISIDPQIPQMDKIAHCAKIIRQGGLVIFPTETVYGIAADSNNPQAMARLVKVKRRSPDKAFAVMVSKPIQLLTLTSSSETAVYKLIDHFWPGPLTAVVPSKDSLTTIGVRMPDHPVALNLVRESQCIVAAPSANIEGSEPPRTCAAALQDLDGLVDVAIDSGEAKWGKSSTVVDCSQIPPKILREGVIMVRDIDGALKRKTILFVCTGNSCRSVMAEFLLKRMLGEREDVEVISAGTGVYYHSRASEETIEVLRKEGIDASPHLSQPVNALLLKKADLIFAMTKVHRQQILEAAPEVEKRVYLLREFGNTPGGLMDMDVPDPIGKNSAAYEECLWMIKEAIGKIVKLI